MTGPADAQREIDTARIARRWGYGRRRPNPFKPSEFDIHLLLGEVEHLRQHNAALLRVALRARDVWGSWGRVDSKIEALGHSLAEPVAQELVTAALAQVEGARE